MELTWRREFIERRRMFSP